MEQTGQNQIGKTIVTMGVIASGKSTLSEELARALGARYFGEPDEKENGNPYLADFYAEMERWEAETKVWEEGGREGPQPYNKLAGMTQLHLLGKRLQQFLEAQQIALRGGMSVIDAGFYQDTCFARSLVRAGQMPVREFETYAMLYRQMTTWVATPAVIVRVIMSAKVAQTRMVKRYEARAGRVCENVIPVSYLEELDDEIGLVCDHLQLKGSHVITYAWEDDRGTPEDRAMAVAGLAEKIRHIKVSDPFLNYHARIV